MKVKYNRKILIIVVIALFFMILFNVKVYATETTFSLDYDNVNVNLNGTKYISYNGGTGPISWSSSDPSIATVENGTVEGKKIGTTTITATRGEETAVCTVNVTYDRITIGGNYGNNVSSVNLVLNEHDTENLYAKVEDGKGTVIENASVTWSSSDTSIVTVNSTGTITAKKSGTATITASAAGVTVSCEVIVAKEPAFTNFTNAKYQLLFDIDVDLKITGVTPNDKNDYYYIITSNNTKPTISKSLNGGFDAENTAEAKYLSANLDENYIYARNLDKYVELNQDLYLWIIEDVKLDEDYSISEENRYISHSTKFVVEGEKLTRPELPQLNLILKSLSIWGGVNSANTEEYSSIHFRFPSDVENRKFKIKIGRVTDNSILQKIQNNDYSGITALLTYAKSNEAVYTADLTTTRENYYSNDKALFDGFKLLKHKAYYYIYVEFDDENGKYYPIEGVTLGQAWIGSEKTYWDIYAYTADNFEWNNLSTTPVETDKNDETLAPGEIPQTGISLMIVFVVITVVAISEIFYKKYSNYKDIK